jgi:hypothetical protein
METSSGSGAGPGGSKVHLSPHNPDVDEGKPEAQEYAYLSWTLWREWGVNQWQTVSERAEEHRVLAQKYYTSASWALAYRGFMDGVSVLSLLHFITRTYLTDRREYEDVIMVYDVIEWFLGAAIAFDWFLQYLLVERKLLYLSSFYSIVDLCSVLSIFTRWGREQPSQNGIDSINSFFLYIIFGMDTTRILRALRLRRLIDDTVVDPVDRFVGVMSLIMSIFILFAAALVQYLEQDNQKIPYHTWAYFIWIITATVGYGDMGAQSTPGRYAIISIIAWAVFTVPRMTNELLELMAMQSVYSRMSYVPKGKRSQHIVICGDIRSLSIQEFFGELFHEDHENEDLNVVLLQPDTPSVEIALMLRDSVMSLYITYLQGSALNDKDLERAGVTSAVAVFVMANKFSVQPDEEDAKSILQQFSIRRYCAGTIRTATPLFCLQLIRPENERHLATNEAESTESGLVIVCFNEIKMGVLAKAIMFPGTNTLVMNLISSFADEEDEDAEEMEKLEVERKRELNLKAASFRGGSAFNLDIGEDDDIGGDGAANSNSRSASIRMVGSQNAKKGDWLKEYKSGCGWEIYSTQLSDIFEDVKFVDMAYIVYQRLGVIVIGLQVRDLKYDVSKVFLNPAKYIIPSLSEFEITAFVLAENKADSNLHEMNVDDWTFFKQALANESAPPSPVQSSSSNPAASFLARLSSKTRVYAGTAASKRNMTSPSAGNASGRSDEESKPKKKQLWKLLKRSNLLQKKIEMDSFQEKLQKLEEKHMIDHYYYRTIPIDIDECFVKTSVVEEIAHINNHLVIMGKDLSNLYDLIRPLRAKYLGSLKYIVILSPTEIPHAVWKRICYFDAIIVVRGSSLEESDIRRAGIFRAAQVVILADSAAYEKSMNAGSVEMESLIDSDSVFTFQCIRRLNPHTQVVVEIVQHENIAYMDTELALKKEQYKFTPQFASGSLFTTSLLDSLVCQAFYSPDIIKVVNKLVNGVDRLERAELLVTASIEQGLVLAEEDDRYKAIHSPLNTVESSCLYLIPVPDSLTKKTFGNLFKLLAKDNCVPLGLLRGIFSQMAMGPKSNKLPYVFTNPDRDCEVFSCDRVFVLSTVPIQANRLAVKVTIYRAFTYGVARLPPS